MSANKGHEQVVKRLEAAAEADRLGHRDVGLDFKVFGLDIPRRRPVGPEAIGLSGGEPARFLAALGRARAARHDQGGAHPGRASSRISDGSPSPS